MWITQSYLQIHHISAFPSYKHSLEGDTAQFHPASYTDILLIPRSTEGRRLSWPGWLTHSGRLTHEVVTRQPWIRRKSGKVRRLQTDVLTTEPRRLAPRPNYHNVKQSPTLRSKSVLVAGSMERPYLRFVDLFFQSPNQQADIILLH